MDHDFALRAPWYARRRDPADPLAPVIQKYDRSDFATLITQDPTTSLPFTEEDTWSFPARKQAVFIGKGRDRLATHVLVHTDTRKLYQANHNRYYAVVVEVFCADGSLARAGSHRDIEVGMVVRKWDTALVGDRGPIRRMARDLMFRMAAEQHPGQDLAEPALDVRNLWWADQAARLNFERRHAGVTVEQDLKSWNGTAWAKTSTVDWKTELKLPMWRLPPRDRDCAAAATRSLWFGLLPVYSADLDPDGAPRLDDQSTYQVQCYVHKIPARGHEHCPPKVWWSAPTEAFRLASFFDPEGTRNHRVAVTAPDLRALAASAGQPRAGGMAITTPAESQLSATLADVTKGNQVKPGQNEAAGVCTFAIELFFLVALFLFNLFLPVVVFLFQLWWLLALRFCVPPSGSLTALEDYFAAGGKPENLPTGLKAELDKVLGFPGSADQLAGDPQVQADPTLVGDLVTVSRPPRPEDQPAPPTPYESEPDPLCSG
ncbi:hypothetical protein GCM10010174_19510 [Kutzneria viridogrisea]|uniref:Uncharacterized protein n=1 Tax=Kutzneria viridogrisea TaxID=47990 RepID=A0ABR6B8A3_9PSEU|nr:hypothetical protein [Kutzneria viridogrisea]